MRSRQWDRSWAMRSATPISFRSRTRSVLGGDNLDGDTSVGVQSQWWCDLGGTISAARTQQRDLVGASGVGARPSSLTLSLSLSLRICEPINDLKVKQKLHSFSGSKALFYCQSKWFSRKLYFTCATKHTERCKRISWNRLKPKQTQPK